MRPAGPHGTVAIWLLAPLLLSPRVGEASSSYSSVAPSLFTTGNPLAASGALQIAVFDSWTGAPVVHAELRRPNGPDSVIAISDSEGEILVSGLGPGSAVFEVGHVSYRTSPHLRLEIQPGRTTHHRLALHPRVFEMEEVVVSGSEPVFSDRVTAHTRRLTTHAMSALPNPSDDVFQMIRVLPSVYTDDLGGAFHVRGGGADETLVRIDGLEIRHLFHGRDFGGISSIIPFQAVEKVDVYSGGFPAQYGGKLSGVMDIDLREGGPSGFHGKVAADLVSSRALGEYNSDTRSLLISAREGYLDRIMGAVQDRAVIEPVYRDFLLRGVYRPQAAHSISLNYLRSEEHLFYEDKYNDHFVNGDYVDHYLWSTARGDLLEWISLEGTLHWSSARQLRLMNSNDRDDNRLERLGGRIQARSRFGHHLTSVGIQHDRDRGEAFLASGELVSIDSGGDAERFLEFSRTLNLDRTRTAFFAQDEWTPIPSLELNAGVRLTSDSDLDRLALNPRASITWHLSEGALARAAWGRYEQSPDVGLEGDRTLRFRSDRAERAEHRVIGVQKEIGDNSLGIDFYDKAFPRLNGVVARRQGGEIDFEVITRGRAQGVEVHWSRETQTSNWWVAYTLGRSEWGNDRWVFSRNFDRLHSFSFANTFSLGSNWDVGTSYTFHSGLPYTEQQWRQDGATGEWIVEEGIPNRNRLPDYQRLDLRLRRHFRFENWQMAVYVEGLNFTNHDNVLWYAWGFRERGGERVPQRTPRTGMPGVPSLGVEIQF